MLQNKLTIFYQKRKKGDKKIKKYINTTKKYQKLKFEKKNY